MTAKKTEPKTKGRSIQDFRENHDKSYMVPKRIRDAIEKLEDSWLYEMEFMKLAGISSTDIGTYRDEFEEFWFSASYSGRNSAKRIWCGTKALANKLREMA